MAWRSVFIELKGVLSEDDYAHFQAFFDKMDAHLCDLLSLPGLDTLITDPSLKFSGAFREKFFSTYGKPNHTWSDIAGNSAKYARIAIAQVRHILLSIQERHLVSQVCQNYGWDAANMTSIRNDLSSLGLYPTTQVIRNICRAKSMPKIPANAEFILDCTTEDSQVSTINQNGDNLDIVLRIDGRVFNLSIPIPGHVRDNIKKWARPKVSRNGMWLSYDVEPMNAPLVAERSLGVDLGLVKAFSASVQYGDGTYSTELLPSCETENLNEKVRVLDTEIQRNYDKAQRIEQLLEGKEDLYLAKHYRDINSYRLLCRNKRTKVKKHLAFLLARDVVNHALENRCSTIKLEDLSWAGNRGGKWHYSDVQRTITMIAELFGIDVVLVPAKGTSRTDPFTGKSSQASATRQISTVAGKLDRDYVASLNIGNRQGKSKFRRKKKCKPTVPLKPNRCRDKHRATPKHPKTKPRTTVRKQIKKQTYQFGASLPVELSTTASNTSLHRRLDRDSLALKHENTT